jgi:hypothetical protein
MTNPNRVQKGVPTAGRFAPGERTEPAIHVGPDSELPNVATASVAEVRTLAHSKDPIVLAELTSSPVIPDDVLEQLADPAQDTSVRLAAVNTGYAGTADRAAEDPNPLVRAAALAGYDLSDDNRQRLGRDTKVRRVIGLISR